jgi:hypothetical protein
MCVTRAEFWEAVEGECTDARAQAAQYSKCNMLLDETRRERDEANGALNEYRDIDALRLIEVRNNERLQREIAERWSTWSVVWISVGVLVAGLGGGLAIGLSR